MFIRKAAEAVGVAGVLVRDPSTLPLWTNRKKHLLRHRRRFGRSSLFPPKSRLRGRLLAFFDRASDFGTHANIGALLGRRTSRKEGEQLRMTYAVYDDDPRHVHAHLLHLLRAQVETYFAFKEVFSDHFRKDEQLALREAELQYRYRKAVDRFRAQWPDAGIDSNG